MLDPQEHLEIFITYDSLAGFRKFFVELRSLEVVRIEKISSEGIGFFTDWKAWDRFYATRAKSETWRKEEG